MAKKKQKTHKKPTQEDLDKTLEEAKNLKDAPKVEEEVVEEEVEEEKVEEEEVEEEVEEKPEEVQKEEKEEVDEEVEEKPKVDFKKKFSESSREAQKISAENKEINKVIDSADDIPEPTEEEMMEEYTDWDMMDDSQKKLAKEATISKRFREDLSSARKEGKKVEIWNDLVDKFIDNPQNLIKYSGLEGRMEDFKIYATEKSSRDVPFKVLVPAFLHDFNPPVKNKGSMFPKGSPGPAQKGDTKLTIEQGRQLRQTDHKKWKEYLIAGKIQMDPSIK